MKAFRFWIVSFQAHFTFVVLQNKNFIVLLSDQSPGAKIGQKSAAVVNITNGKLIRAVLTAIPMHHSVFLLHTLPGKTLTTEKIYRSLQEPGQALSQDLKSMHPKRAIIWACSNEQFITQHIKK